MCVLQLNNAAYAMLAANASIQKAAEQQAAMMHLTQANPGALPLCCNTRY